VLPDPVEVFVGRLVAWTPTVSPALMAMMSMMPNRSRLMKQRGIVCSTVCAS
jgi:hypothetical protein